MTAKITYKIAKQALPFSDPQEPLEWLLIRCGTIEGRINLPEDDAAIFTSEAEANLFAVYLAELREQNRD